MGPSIQGGYFRKLITMRLHWLPFTYHPCDWRMSLMLWASVSHYLQNSNIHFRQVGVRVHHLPHMFSPTRKALTGGCFLFPFYSALYVCLKQWGFLFIELINFTGSSEPVTTIPPPSSVQRSEDTVSVLWCGEISTHGFHLPLRLGLVQ